MIASPHILLLAEYGATGGTRTYFKQLLALYAEKKARVTVLRTYKNKDDEIDYLCDFYGFECVESSTIVGTRNLFQGRLPFRHIIERYLFKNFIKKTGADIVVASVGTPELFLGAISNVSKAIYILHTYPDVSSNYVKHTLKKLFFKNLISSHTKILTVSDFSRNRIIQAWGMSNKSNNVDVLYSTVGDIVTYKSLNVLNELHILTVGHVVTYKNPDVWIRMAILLKQTMPLVDFIFTWVGDGELLNKCQNKVKNLGAESYIKFIGRDDEIAKYYEQCDIYVQPSLIESLGLSVLDAMRYGKPCVVANTGGLPELVHDGRNGWVVDANDHVVMAKKIGLLESKVLREQMGALAIKLYQDMFTKDKWKEQMWRHHESVANIS